VSRQDQLTMKAGIVLSQYSLVESVCLPTGRLAEVVLLQVIVGEG